MNAPHSCIIIGAGISGLIAAAHLKRHHVDVLLLDKGRHHGGRMATRTIDKSIFDHGAQFVTTREPIFREMVEGWMNLGIARPWYKGPLGNMRYVGVNGMSTIPRELAKDLNVHLSEKVTKIRFDKGKWTVTARKYGEESDNSYEADCLVITAPVPQALALLQESNIQIDFDEEEELERITYFRAISVMAQLNGPAGLSNPGAMDLNHPVLRWIGDNSAKGVSPTPGSVSITSSPQFAERYWDAPDEERIPVLLNAAKPFLKNDVVDAVAHRWGFTEPKRVYKEKQPFRKTYFLDEEHHLGMCGDGFGGPRIEASAMSGHALAKALTRPI